MRHDKFNAVRRVKREQFTPEQGARETKIMAAVFAALVIIGWLVVLFGDVIDGWAL